MKSLIAVALCLLLGLPALVDAKDVLCRGLKNGTNVCLLHSADPAIRCTAKDITGGEPKTVTFKDDEPALCVTTVTRRAGVVTLFRGKTTETGATTCVELCKRYREKEELLYFGCVKKTDGDFFNFGMPDNNVNSEVLTYLPLNVGPYKCPEEVQSLPLELYQSAAVGVVGAGIVSIVVGAIILYFGWVRSMSVSGRPAEQPSAPPMPGETSF